MFTVLKKSARFLRLGTFLRDKSPCAGLLHANSFFCTESISRNGPDIAALTNGDKELEHKLKVLILEIDVMRQEGKLVPEDEYLEQKHWKELLTLPTLSQRRKFLEFLFKLEKTQKNRKEKKELKKKEHSGPKPVKQENETFEEFVSKYDLGHNNIFLRFYDTTINQMYNNRLIQAMQFGQKLVVDCGYYNDMNRIENKNCAKQLMLLFAENRAHDDPYDLHFCNINRRSILLESLHKYITTMYEPWFPLSLHESSYLEQFPKDKLVYLTPHCREEMVEYDHDAIYIIGGIVDKVNTQPLSLAKAKREGVKMAKLPLDRYLQWGAGSGKSLTLNQVASILLDVKLTGDWKYAMRHVPKRKVVDFSEQRMQKQEKTWTPSNKVDFGNLSYKGKKDRRVQVKSLMYD